jgi:hypothetical protein
VTDFAALIITVQEAPETESHPLQLEKKDPVAALAVRVTTVPLSYWAEQVEPQLIPLGFEVTVPLPAPDLAMVSVKATWVKVAVTDFAALKLTVQEAPETESHPLQLEKTDPVAAVAVRVTTVPLSYWAEQVEPQSIPLGLEVTVPLPGPDLATVSVNRTRVKVGVTDLDAFIVTLQSALETESQPLHVSNVDPAAGDAVRVKAVPVL